MPYKQLKEVVAWGAADGVWDAARDRCVEMGKGHRVCNSGAVEAGAPLLLRTQLFSPLFDTQAVVFDIRRQGLS